MSRATLEDCSTQGPLTKGMICLPRAGSLVRVYPNRYKSPGHFFLWLPTGLEVC